MRELYLLEGVVSDAAATCRKRIDVGKNGDSVTVVVWDSEADEALVGVVEKIAARWRIPAESLPVSTFEIRGTPGTHLPSEDAIENLIGDLRPALPGVSITADPVGAIVRGPDASLENVLQKIEYGALVVTPTGPTSWQVSWNTSYWPDDWSPEKRRLAVAGLPTLLRRHLGDPMDLDFGVFDDELRLAVPDPTHNSAFIASANAALAARAGIAVRQISGVKLVLRPTLQSKRAIPSLTGTGARLLPDEYFDLVADLQSAACPSVRIRVSGDTVLAETSQEKQKNDMAAIVRRALAGRTDLSIDTVSSGEFRIALRQSAHLAAPPPQPTSEEFVAAVQFRLNAARLTARVTSLDSEHARVEFSSAAGSTAFRKSLSKPGLTIRLVDDGPDHNGDEKLRDEQGRDVWLRPGAIITGDMLQDASVDTSPYSKEPVVNFQFNDEGKIRFASFTRRNVGQRFAIIVDRVVISAPVVKSEIAGGRGYIEGNFTTDTAKALVQKILPFRDQLLLKVEP